MTNRSYTGVQSVAELPASALPEDPAFTGTQ